MKAIRYMIEALSPLLFTSNTGDPNMVASLDYIPGTHIRGLFANEYIKRMNLIGLAEKDEYFFKWFLKGDLKFLSAHIAAKDKNGDINIHYPIPFSIQKEKYSEDYYDLFFTEDDKETKIEYGYCVLDGSQIYKESVATCLNFHHARDRERGTSKEGIIFNYESISEGQIFVGYILGKEEDLNELLKIITEGIYYLGRSRNNQYGKIRFSLFNKEPEPFESEIKVKELNAGEAVLTLLSDTIIYNENGFSVIDLAELEKEIGCKIKKSFIKVADEEGFISKWKLKTPQERCFKAGSCFLIDIKQEDIESLKELQKTGIGEMTHAGFGRFVIGWQKINNESYTKEVEKREIIDKPLGKIPESVKNLINKLIFDNLVSHYQRKAFNEVINFKNLPPPSLISKLEKAVIDDKLEQILDGKNLKATAKNNLEICRNNSQTLLNFLKCFTIEDGIPKDNDSLQKLCEEVAYKPTEQELAKLRKSYLSTFLNTMRKQAKQKESKEAK